MRSARAAALGIPILLFAACGDEAPTQAPLPIAAPVFSIGDGPRDGEVPGFVWLTPVEKKGPKAFDGTFDPALDPMIDICAIASDAAVGSAACSGPVLRTLSAASQPEIIRVDLEKENYSVTWQSTNTGDIVAGELYRAIARVGTRELGWVDLEAVARQQDAKHAAAGFVGLVVGSPFVFKMRIETGIPGTIEVTPTSAKIFDDETQAFTALVKDLHGVILPGVTVDWLIDDGAIAVLSPTSQATDGNGESSSTATPELGVGGTTTVRARSQGIEGTATLEVELAVGSVVVSPSSATIWDDETQSFTATVLSLVGNPLAGRTVTWSGTTVSFAPSSGTSNASGEATTTATPTGTTAGELVQATSEGVSGTATIVINQACGPNGRDTDGDRLVDCYETNDGVFVSATATGTDPNVADTDGDFINDGDEVLGTTGGLNLPAMGVSALRRNILLEYDWFNDNNDPGVCGAHSHAPTAAAIAVLNAAFASAPVNNPDGSTGITVINDYGQGGAFTGGNLINDADGVIAGGVNGTDLANYKAANFAANRNGYFRYVLMPHRYGTTSNSSGQAELPGDDMIVSLQCFNSTTNIANTIMHELGHNLNLRHGGFEDQNRKPNYNSVMNYNYQFPGIDNNCTPPGDGVLSYSVGTRPDLNENNLDETQGVCGNPPGPAWDWNGDGDATDTGLVFDLNTQVDAVNLGRTILSDYNDWANLGLGGIGDADGAPMLLLAMPQETMVCQDTPQTND